MPKKVIRGDSSSAAIACASVLAKVADGLMKQVARDYPQYGFDKHAGYGTAFHRQAMEIHGLTVYHRRSFKGVG